MYIHEAIKATSKTKPFIARAAWDAQFISPGGRYKPSRLLVTDSPDRCVIFGGYAVVPRIGWQPTAEDLAADDWHPVG